MREWLTAGIKALLIICILFLSIFGLAAWYMPDDPGLAEWVFRILFPSAAIGTAAALWLAGNRRSQVTDYMWQNHGNAYFTRNGFSFYIEPTVKDRTAFLRVYFQNQYNQFCKARIRLTPVRFWWGSKRNLGPFEMTIHCQGAEYNTAECPIQIPPQYQGRHHRFHIRCSVQYPNGYGKRLIYRKGIEVDDAVQSLLRQIVTIAVMIILLPLMLLIIFSRPAGIVLYLPDPEVLSPNDYIRPGGSAV